MLATIILDTFTKKESEQIASALDVLCSPLDHYAFSSAAIYSFWSVPEREILYIGLAKDVTRRFRQHMGLVACAPKGCKVKQVEGYFATKDRIGYSIIVQSAMCHPTTREDEGIILSVLDDDDDAATVDVSDIFEARENIVLAEGMLIDMFERLGDRLPKWNKIRGSKRGRKRRSFFSAFNPLRAIPAILAGKSWKQIESEKATQGPPYELVLNLEGSELSDLNARATLREIADKATFCGHELLLHGIRMLIVSQRFPFDRALNSLAKLTQLDTARIAQMKADGYWCKKVTLPGT